MIDSMLSMKMIQHIKTMLIYMDRYKKEAELQLGCISVSDDGKEQNGFWCSAGLENMMLAIEEIHRYYPAFVSDALRIQDAVKQVEKEVKEECHAGQ